MFSWCKNSDKFLQKFNKKAFKNKPDAFTLGEASGINLKELLKYGYGKNKVADNYFNFSWWWIGWGKITGRNGYDSNWNFKEFIYQQKPFQENQLVKPSMITNFLSNHDTSRSISRWGDENFFWKESAKTHALLLMILKGIPCIYYGEELGLLNTNFDNREQFKDCDIVNAFDSLVDNNKIYSESEFIKYCNINSRDAGRSLMQWDESINAGFNKGQKPWIKLGRQKHKINCETELKDKKSIFNFYRHLINLRKNTYHDILIKGTSQLKILKNGVFQIKRQYNNQIIYGYINMRSKELKFKKHRGKQLLSTYDDNKIVKSILRPYESILILKGE